MSNVVPFQRVTRPSRLVIVGNGMAAAKLLDEIVSRGDLARFAITVIGDEPYPCYNRILLNQIVTGAEPAAIVMKDRSWFTRHGVTLRTGTRVSRLDLETREVICSDRSRVPFDDVVLATGSRAALPHIEGLREDDSLKGGVFVQRTIGDALELRDAVRPGVVAVVVGGGLLGLEAASGLLNLGARVTVVHRSPGLMERQLDTAGGTMLAAQMRRLGIECIGGRQVRLVRGEAAVTGVELDDGSLLPCQVLVLACGVQPRVEVARASGIPVRRAIHVDDELSVPGLSGVYAVGECAEHRGRVYGTVSPIYEQVRVLAHVLTGRPTGGFAGARVYTRLKVAGVDVASMGELDGAGEDDEVLVVSEPRRYTYRKLVIRSDRLVGAQFVGDANAAARVVQMWDRGDPLPPNRLDALCSEDVLGTTSGEGSDREICNCHRVRESSIVRAIEDGSSTVPEVSARTDAGTGCGSCRGELARLVGLHVKRREAAAS